MKCLIAIAAVLTLSISAQAHRLDEYLQATRISVETHRIYLAIDLTPGVAIAQELLSSIDPGNNPRIPSHHGEKYAEHLLQDLVLDLDGKRETIRLLKTTFPARTDMESGEGTIHLQAVVKLAKLKPGHHELLFQNSHLPEISVYLVNALVPGNKAIQITHQTRDELQKEYRLSFEVKSASR